MNSIYDIRLLNVESIDGQISVYHQSFNPHENYEETKMRWQKKHFYNPIHASFVFGAFDGDKLICINAFMPQKYKYRGKILNVIQSCDSGTLPEYRGKGIWSQVIKYAIDYFKKDDFYDFILGFPNYDNSYRGFLKLNWKDVADVANLIMIGNSVEFVKATGKIQLTSISYVFLLQQLFLKLFAKSNKYTLKKGAIKDAILYTGNSEISLNTDKSFMQWKMKYRNLESFNVFSQDKLIATCYYSIVNYRNEKVILLFDICVKSDIPTGDIKKIYATCVSELLKLYKNIAFIRIWVMTGNKNYELYKNLLFIKSGHHNKFILYPLNAKHISEKTLLNPKLWDNISFMYLD